MTMFRFAPHALILALAAAGTADAATFCVSTPAALDAALQTAEENGESDSIRLTGGLFEDPDGVGKYRYYTSESHSLLIDGGWVRVGGACVIRFADATATVLSGAGVHQVISLEGEPGTNGSITIRNLTIRDGVADLAGTGDNGSGGGLTVGGPGGYTGAVLVDRVIIRNNDASLYGAGVLAGTGGTLVIRNSVFLANRCGSTNCAASLTQNNPAANYSAVFAQNTVVANTCFASASDTCAGGVRLWAGAGGSGLFLNNIFVANTLSDLLLSSPSIDVLYNNYDSIGGNEDPVTLAGNVIGVYPKFVDLFGGNLRLAPDSPVRDAGFALAGMNGDVDLDGLPRVIGPAPDMGAYEEQDVIFVGGFDL